MIHSQIHCTSDMCHFLLSLNLHIICFLHRLSCICFFFFYHMITFFSFFLLSYLFCHNHRYFHRFFFISMFIKLNPQYINQQGDFFFLLLYAWESKTASFMKVVRTLQFSILLFYTFSESLWIVIILTFWNTQFHSVVCCFSHNVVLSILIFPKLW